MKNFLIRLSYCLLLLVPFSLRAKVFNSTMLINGQTTETLKKGALQFGIKHRFGVLTSAFSEFFGIDNAYSYIGFGYGVSRNLMIGMARNGAQINKSYDITGKYHLFRQRQTGFELSLGTDISIFSNDDSKYTSFSNRLGFMGQVLASRRFGKRLSILLSPTFSHLSTPQKSSFTIGTGGAFQIWQRAGIEVEYYPAFSDGSKDAFSIGYSQRTEHHSFQIFFTNTTEMTTLGMMTFTPINQGWRVGFNISSLLNGQKKIK